MEEQKLTLNGLLDGISVVENDNKKQEAIRGDILYNDKEPFGLDIISEYTIANEQAD